MRLVAPEGCFVRAWRCAVGDDAAQVGAPAADELFVAVEVRGGIFGLLLGIDGEQGDAQFLRGTPSGPYEVDEILVYILHCQQFPSVVVEYDVLPEYFHGLTDVFFQQYAVAALHAGNVEP